MRDSWLKLVDSVLRPARPHLERCLLERERHLAARRLLAEERARGLIDCAALIENARAAVFAANDGVVTSRMTELEREWRRLSRSDPDDGLMDLWARITPVSWIDRKRWRDGAPTAQLDVAIALAADAEGVEATESAIGSLRVALAAWGTPIGSRIRWRPFEEDSDVVTELLAEPLRAAHAALCARRGASGALERAQRLERDVHERALARFPERALLARSLSQAAFVDGVFGVAPLTAGPNPVTALRDLWTAGYVLAGIDTSGVTIEIPPL